MMYLLVSGWGPKIFPSQVPPMLASYKGNKYFDIGGGPELSIIKEQTPAGTQRITCQLLVKLLPAGSCCSQDRISLLNRRMKI